MTIDVDVRKQTEFSVTGLIFAKNRKLTGAPDNDVVSVENATGVSAPLCQKADIPDLIKALQAAQKIWGVL
jgi:hypothetical protein